MKAHSGGHQWHRVNVVHFLHLKHLLGSVNSSLKDLARTSADLSIFGLNRVPG